MDALPLCYVCSWGCAFDVWLLLLRRERDIKQDAERSGVRRGVGVVTCMHIVIKLLVPTRDVATEERGESRLYTELETMLCFSLLSFKVSTSQCAGSRMVQSELC